MKRFLTALLSFLMLFGTTANAYEQVYTETYFADPNEEAFQEVCMLSLDSAAMLVNGAVRYISDDNLNLTPKLYEARTYLPLEASEMLYKIYTSESENDINIDLRAYGITGDTRINLTASSAVVDGVQKANEYLIYVDGEPYVAVRAIGELIGKTVLYNNRYIIIGDESYANAVNNNSDYFNYGASIIDSFKPAVQGSVYYASAGALGGGDGTIENPFTLSEASVAASAGDTVYLRGGVYRETLSPQNDGTAAKPVVYKAYANEEVIISALEEVSGFYDDGELLSAEITSVGDGRNQIFYNGEALVEARFPNVNSEDYEAEDVSPLFLTKGGLTVTASDSKRIESDILAGFSDDYWNGAKFISLHGNAYCAGTAVVSDSGDGWFTVDSATVKWWNSQADSQVNYGYLTGHRNCIDLAGEWVVEDNTLVIKAPENETADSLQLEYKVRQLTVDLKNKKYIHIDGIKTIGGGVNMNDSEMCVVKNCEFKYISHYTLSNDQREGYIDSYVRSSSYNVTDENGAPRRGEMGIYVSGKNDVIRNCKIDASAAAGIYMTGLYSYISNNEILNTGYMGSNVSGIYIGAEASLAWGVDGEMASNGTTNINTTPDDISDDESSIARGGYVITNNRVRNAGRNALILQTPEQGWVNNQKQAAYIPCEIAYNRFENGAITSCDTGIVYFWGASMGNDVRKTRFHNNAVSLDCNVPQDNILSMIYYDNYMNGIENYNNLVYAKAGEHKARYEYKANGSWSYVYLVAEHENTVYIQNQNATAEVDSDIEHASCILVVADSIADITEDKYPDGEYFHTGLK